MPLAAGARIGPYEITGTLGAGGMGEVYRARDPRLGRDVALKVLPDAFASDPERLARFQREAQVLASLTHPNIGAIYGLEEAGATRALILELIEGDTLADRIARGPIPVDEAIPVARQIAEALEAAHEQGVIHRDLKPSNIKVSADGVVRVLDFGLAKLAPTSAPHAPDVTASPTITSPAAMTGIGMILGTAAYMAPEQAKGRPADKRSDVWAFGCVLYEMLAGRRAFEGEDVTEMLASVLKTEPDWSALPEEMSPAVRMLVTSCLTKDRRKRMADIGAARFVLEHQAHLSAGGTTPAAAARPRAGFWRRAVPHAALVAVAAVLGAVVARQLEPSAAPPVERFAVTLPPGVEFAQGIRRLLAISPDGTHIVYSANNRLHLRTLDALEAVPIPGTDGAGTNLAMQPFFSPDGQWLAYWQNGQLKKMAVRGGAPIVLATVGGIFSGSWGPDDTVVYSSGTSVWTVSGAGGTPERVAALAAGEVVQGPQLLPGGEHVLFTVATGNWDTAQIVAHSLRDGSRTVLVDGGRDARYLPTGHLIYASRGTLLGVPFDLATLRRLGGPVALAEGIADAGPASGAAHFAVSDEGTLAYIPGGSANALRALTWVDRQGREEPIAAPLRPYAYARISPDGTRIALDIRDDASDIWTWDIARRTLTRLTFDPGLNRGVVWSPDGRRIAFSAQRGGVENAFWQAADGSGAAEQLTHEAVGTFPISFSPDGKHLIVQQPAGAPPRDLAVVALDGDRKVRPLLRGEFDEVNGEVSPDNRWLAYESLESGRQEVYVRPFPDVESGRWQVSTEGGSRPVWARDGRELFYFVEEGTVMAADIQPGPTFAAGTPRRVISGRYVVPLNGRPFDVTRDGRRFLMIKIPESSTETTERPSFVVVQGWFEELKRRVPVP